MSGIKLNLVIGQTPVDQGRVHFGGTGGSHHYNSLLQFHQELIMGKPLPAEMNIDQISVGSIVAATVFLHRDIAMHARTLELVYSASLIERYGLSALAHVDRSLVSEVFAGLNPESTKALSLLSTGNLVIGAVNALRRWCLGEDFELASPLPPLDIKASSKGACLVRIVGPHELEKTWLSILSQGFLQAVILPSEEVSSGGTMIYRKSVLVPWRPRVLAAQLNQRERAAAVGSLRGGSSSWVLSNGDLCLSNALGSRLAGEEIFNLLVEHK